MSVQCHMELTHQEHVKGFLFSSRAKHTNELCLVFFFVFLVAFIFSIIFPTYYSCRNEGREQRTCQELAWYVAIASNFMTGIILLLLCVFGEFIRRNTPGVALLSSISGIGFTYLALNEYLPVAASPIVSFVPFAIVMLGYFAGGKFFSWNFLRVYHKKFS